MSPLTVPHYRTIVGFCVVAIVGYAICSGWVLWHGDAAQQGDMIGTWKSLAVGAFGFWIGSSMGGKTKPADGEPTPVTIENRPSAPVPTTNTDLPRPATDV